MSAEKEPPRKREYLPPLKHTTIHTLLSGGPDTIRTIAASHGHSRLIGGSVVQEDSMEAASARARAATESIRSNMPKGLSEGVSRGRKYWHSKREVFVTVIQCSVGRFPSGEKQHLVVDDDGQSFKAAESYLEIV